jgi:uncharacterized protein YqjF (DUF2071 family)
MNMFIKGGDGGPPVRRSRTHGRGGTTLRPGTSSLSAAARASFLACEGRPLFLAGWQRTLFIHYEVPAAALQPLVPYPLDLWAGRAYVSLVAFTLTRLRFFDGGPAFATHGFLNLRTYIPGNSIYFLAEWLPHPLCVVLGPRLYGLPYRLGSLDYRHDHESGRICGRVRDGAGIFEFGGPIDPRAPFASCVPGSLDEFLLERYTAQTRRGPVDRYFRVWHPTWPQVPLEITVFDDSLLAATGSWFPEARRAGANYSPGFPEVWMGRPRRRSA